MSRGRARVNPLTPTRLAEAWLQRQAICRMGSPKVANRIAAILANISHMEAAWNRGDFRGYMAGFKNPDVIFVSGGKFQEGWQGTLDHYIRDYGGSPERRGRLHFYNMRVDLLAPDAAMLIECDRIAATGTYAELRSRIAPRAGLDRRRRRLLRGQLSVAWHLDVHCK